MLVALEPHVAALGRMLGQLALADQSSACVPLYFLRHNALYRGAFPESQVPPQDHHPVANHR